MTRYEYKYGHIWTDGGTLSSREEARTIAGSLGLCVREVGSDGVAVWEFHPVIRPTIVWPDFFVKSPYDWSTPI